MKNWRVRTKLNHIKEPCKNENFIFYAYKWIRLVYPKANFYLYENTEGVTLSIDNGLRRSDISHYKAFKGEVDLVLTMAVIRKMMRGWARLPREVLKFKEKHKAKYFHSLLMALKFYTTTRRTIKIKINKSLNNATERLKKVINVVHL